MWAYILAFNSSCFGPLLFLMTSILLVGMLELAKMFSDPFVQTSDSAFPLHDWFQKFVQNNQALLETKQTEGCYDACSELDQDGLPAEVATRVGEIFEQPWDDLADDDHSKRSLLVPIVRRSRPPGHYEA